LGRKKNKGALSVAVCSGKPAGLYDPDGVAIVTFGGAGIGARSLRSSKLSWMPAGALRTSRSWRHQRILGILYFESACSFPFFLTYHRRFGKTRFRTEKAMAGHGFLKGVDSACAEFTDVPARIHGQLEQTKEQRKEINL